MTTTMKEQTFGIEVEMVMSRRKAATIIAEHFGTSPEYTGGCHSAWHVHDDQGRTWKLMSDSSICTAAQEYKCEFVSPVCHWDDIELVQTLIRKLRAGGAVADPSCGIHVHIGLGDHTPQTLRNLVNLVNAHEKLLTESLDIDRDRRSTWCRPVDQDFLRRLNRVKPTSLERLATLWYDDEDWQRHAASHYDPSRYRLLYVE